MGLATEPRSVGHVPPYNIQTVLVQIPFLDPVGFRGLPVSSYKGVGYGTRKT